VDWALRPWTQAFHNTNLWTALRNNGLLLLSVRSQLASPCASRCFFISASPGGGSSIHLLSPDAISWVVLGLVAERFLRLPRHVETQSFTRWAFLTSARTCWATSPRRSSRLHHVRLHDDRHQHDALSHRSCDLGSESREAARLMGAGRCDIFAASLCPPETLHPTGIRHDSDRALLALFSLIFVMTGGGPATRPRLWSFSFTKPASIKVTWHGRALRPDSLRDHRHRRRRTASTHRSNE